MGGHKKRRINAPVRAKVKKWFGSMLALALVLGYYTPQAQTLRALPESFAITLGQVQRLQLGLPFSVKSASDEVAVLSSDDERLSDEIVLSGKESGNAELTFNLLGFLPLKKVKVEVQPERLLVPGGEALGVALQTKGVMVVGTSDLGGSAGASPARLCGIKPGDIILAVDEVEIKDSKHLAAVVSTVGSRTVNVSVSRDDKHVMLEMTPKRDASSGTFRIGAWVRDSTAGVGTLSFYDPETKGYGALGHAITDADTGKPLSVSEGQVLKADVVDVNKGQKGTPGELKGSFLREKLTVGDITKNTVLGIYGKLTQTPTSSLYPDGLPVGLRSTVHKGEATIISTVDAQGPKEYKVEITQVNAQSGPNQKSMVIKVTDPALIEKTGGIVQGMSGSPILQDGHLIGAVTHVFVSDPTQGYGLYIDWMLDTLVK